MGADYFSFTHHLFDSAKTSEKPEALEGIRVLDLARVIYGPMVSKWLALFGATVIKVEEPDLGDDWRTGSYWAKYWKDSCPYFQSLNPNKYFVGIDLKKKRGKELLMELARQSDVVVENYRAGLAEAWGIGYTSIKEVNPGIIYISCCGYGQWGPLRFFPSWDLIAQSMSGVARLTGFPGQQTFKLNDYYGDFFPGLLGAIGVLAALNFRERTGEGQFIDMAQAEALMRTMHNWIYMSVTGEDLKRTGNFDPTMAPSGIFRTSDGRFISVAVATDGQFSALAEAMGRPELAREVRFSGVEQRLKPEHAEEINAMLGDWIATRTEDEIMDLARKKGFPAAPVKDDWELVNDKWRRERGSLVDFDDEMYGRGTWVGPAVALEKTPGRLKTLTRPIGYHNRYVLKKYLRLSEEEIQKLERDRVIGYWVNRVGLRPPAYWEADRDPVFNYQGEAEE